MFVKQLDGSYAESEAIGSISARVVDDTINFEVPVSVVRLCEDYFIESECLAAGCHWWDGKCHKMPPGVMCSDYTTESTCDAAGCYWWDDRCNSTPEVPEPPWLIILAAVGGVIAVIGVIVAIRR